MNGVVTNTQLFISICVPVSVLILGFIWNAKMYCAEIGTVRSNMNVLRSELNVFQVEINGKFDLIMIQLAAINRTMEIIQQDLKRFNEVTISLDKRLEVVERR